MLVISYIQDLPLRAKQCANPNTEPRWRCYASKPPCRRGQRCAERYLGERNEELLKLLSPLHKLSENRSASFPSP